MEEKRKVYAIMHNKTHRTYIGSSHDPLSRIRSHMQTLRSGNHRSATMQEDFNKYGADYSVFDLDWTIDLERRNCLEESFWMFYFNTKDEYNYRDNMAKSRRKIETFRHNEEAEAMIQDMFFDGSKVGLQVKKHRDFSGVYGIIADICKERGISIRQLEIAAGLANGVIRKWDKSTPYVDSLMAVADVLGVTIDDLAGELP